MRVRWLIPRPKVRYLVAFKRIIVIGSTAWRLLSIQGKSVFIAVTIIVDIILTIYTKYYTIILLLLFFQLFPICNKDCIDVGTWNSTENLKRYWKFTKTLSENLISYKFITQSQLTNINIYYVDHSNLTLGRCNNKVRQLLLV